MAGLKAIIVKSAKKYEGKNYESVLLLGIKNSPLKITRKMSTKKTFKKSRIKMFLKIFNVNHLLPTRYVIDISDIKDLIPEKRENIEQISEDLKNLKSENNILLKFNNIFSDRFFAGKNKWFYKKMKF